MAWYNFFTKKKKKAIPTEELIKEDAFSVQESTQEYRLRNFGYLYEAPQDNLIPLYKQLYNNVPVLDGAITTYTDLVTTGWSISSDDPAEAELVTKELKATNFDKVLKVLMDDYFIYGYYGAEIVLSNKFDKLEKLQEIPTEELRFERDDEANITNFVQQGRGKVISINPKKVLFAANRGTTLEPYGRSLFRSLPWITRIMLEMQDSMSNIYSRYGSPRYHVKYSPAIQLDQAELTARLNAIKNKFKDIAVGQDFFTAADIEIGIIGAGTGEQFKLTIEMTEIMQSVFSGLKIPAGVLGYNYGSTETHLTQQIEILLGRIIGYQNEQENVIDNKLMPIMAIAYNLKSIPRFKFDKPVIVDELKDIQLETSKINNVKSLIELNMITTEDGQQKLGLEVKKIDNNPKEAEPKPKKGAPNEED